MAPRGGGAGRLVAPVGPPGEAPRRAVARKRWASLAETAAPKRLTAGEQCPEPVGLCCPLGVTAFRPPRVLGREGGDEGRDVGASLAGTALRVLGIRPGHHVVGTRIGDRPRPGGRRVPEILRRSSRPRVDAADEPSARRHELAPDPDDVPVELDLPELVVRPEREVVDAAGMDALLARHDVGSLDPAPGLPAEAGERADRAGAEKLVRVHARPKLLKARQSSSSTSGESASAGSSPVTAIATRNCSR